MCFALILLVRRLVRYIVTPVVVRASKNLLTPLLVWALLAVPNSAPACSVCFGDPDSPMTKGAVAGVYVMIGFISFVLLGISGTACFWMVRCRRIALTQPTSRTNL